MMMIRMAHPEHGEMNVYDEQQKVLNENHGWKVVPEPHAAIQHEATAVAFPRETAVVPIVDPMPDETIPETAFISKGRKKREWTAEERKAAGERMAKARAAKKAA